MSNSVCLANRISGIKKILEENLPKDRKGKIFVLGEKSFIAIHVNGAIRSFRETLYPIDLEPFLDKSIQDKSCIGFVVPVTTKKMKFVLIKYSIQPKISLDRRLYIEHI